MLNGKTIVTGIFGNPVEHSLSPQMHNAAFEVLGINAVYVPFLTHDIENAVLAIRALNIRGVSVTIPFKKAVMNYIDEIEEIGLLSSSVNTLINDNGKIIGTNSDGYGAIAALEEKTTLGGKNVVILGNGGSALGIASAIMLKDNVKTLKILGRSLDRLSSFAASFKKASGKKIETGVLNESQEQIFSADIIINTTPIGMSPNYNASPLDKTLLEKHHTVFDIVYTPKQTKLLEYALEKGATAIYGYKMLLHQAIIQFERWTLQKPPIEIMEEVLLKELGRRNV